jgi:hypothetical protein
LPGDAQVPAGDGLSLAGPDIFVSRSQAESQQVVRFEQTVHNAC